MKLYSGTTRRIFKKRVKDYKAFERFVTLKEGDLIHTCRGYNEIMSEVTAIIYHNKLSKNNWYIGDFDIVTESGACCSFIHCCDFPWTKKQITDYWKNLTHDWFINTPLSIAAKEGRDIVDEDGQILAEFCEPHVKEVRFKHK